MPDIPNVKPDTSNIVDPSPLPGFRRAEGALRAKWRAVQDQINQDTETLARCRAAPDLCNSPEARRFLAIVDAARARTGRALIGEINRAINLAIRPADDMARHGAPDVWTAPLATLAAGRGDCEDYAIAKLVALREAGMRDEDLRLLVVHDAGAREHHAIVAARLDGRWLLLDNKRFTLMDLADTRYLPLYALQADENRQVAVNAAETGSGVAPVF